MLNSRYKQVGLKPSKAKLSSGMKQVLAPGVAQLPIPGSLLNKPGKALRWC